MNSGASNSRLVSLDALRGFDMFWIIGARGIADGLTSLNLPIVSTIARQLSHSKWNGFTFYDLIFPLFIFITGVSLIFSLQKRLERGDSRKAIVKHVITRTVILFLLGIVYNGVAINLPLSSIRVMGVLQRIALCSFFCSIMIIYTKPRFQVVMAVGILVGYWATMRFVPVPGYGAGIWTEQGNLAHYIDRFLLPGRKYFGSWDPEGLLSTIPAVATCLLGVLTGRWLKTTECPNGHIMDTQHRTLNMFLASLVLITLGIFVSPIFPINKTLWTSSFVLLTGGLSIMLFAGFHWIFDIWGYQRLAFPFVIIGMNSIFIYLAVRFVPFEKIALWVVGVDFLMLLGQGKTLVLVLIQLLLQGFLLLWLYHRKTFFKI